MTENLKVLMIDDEADFCFFVKENLMRDGKFNVLIATSGKHGIELAVKEMPDIILLDLVMPDMSGGDVADTLKKNPVTMSIPILYITALATHQDIVENKGKKTGNNHILPKPVRTKKLIETILNILNRT